MSETDRSRELHATMNAVRVEHVWPHLGGDIFGWIAVASHRRPLVRDHRKRLAVGFGDRVGLGVLAGAGRRSDGSRRQGHYPHTTQLPARL